MRLKIIASIAVVAVSGILGTDIELRSADSYVTDYTVACEKYGQEYNICPELLEAIIEADVDGEGVMHLDSAEQAARMKRLNISNLQDPDSNILVGTDYLLELFETREDPYEVVGTFIDSEDPNEINAILSRSCELEREHNK